MSEPFAPFAKYIDYRDLMKSITAYIGKRIVFDARVGLVHSSFQSATKADLHIVIGSNAIVKFETDKKWISRLNPDDKVRIRARVTGVDTMGYPELDVTSIKIMK